MIDGVERLGIYGGTFAPIHNGHVAAAKAFYQQMKLDKLLIVPAFIPPHKYIDAQDTPEHRFKMCELAFQDDPNIEISNIEYIRGGTSFTVDTLKSLTAPNRKLFLLCGTDMMLTFDKWHKFEEIFRLCCPVYIRRDNDAELDSMIIQKNSEYYSKYNVAFRKIVVDPIELSSTEIRHALKARENVADLVPHVVFKYINDHHLYET